MFQKVSKTYDYHNGAQTRDRTWPYPRCCHRNSPPEKLEQAQRSVSPCGVDDGRGAEGTLMHPSAWSKQDEEELASSNRLLRQYLYRVTIVFTPQRRRKQHLSPDFNVASSPIKYSWTKSTWTYCCSTAAVAMSTHLLYRRALHQRS